MVEFLLEKHFIALFLVLLFGIRLSSRQYRRESELRYFWMTLVCCFLLILEDIFESVASDYPDLRFWRTLLSVAGYALRSTAILSLLLVVLRPEHRTWKIWIPNVINLLVCSTAFFSDITFGFDADYAFYRGPLGFVPFIVPLFYLGCILWVTFRHYSDRGQKEDPLILITCAILCLLSALLDASIGGVRLHAALLISSVFFYVFLRSYDIRRDSLTLLLNRQSLYEDFDSIGRSVCAAASLDMNGLKVLNETEGYTAGDAALKKIADLLRESSSPNMRAYRIGGDEFVLLFFRMDEISVRHRMDEVRSRIDEAGCSVSCGCVMRGEKEDLNDLLSRSEVKMFEHKAQFYREKSLDLRRKAGDREEKHASGRDLAVIESSPQPVAVYRFVDHRIETMAVSDGFCELFGYADRGQAAYVLDHGMYKDVHPDDQERMSGAMLRFSEGSEPLDIVYRTAEGMTSGYRVVHARGSHIHDESGMHTAYIWYMNEGEYRDGDEDMGSPVNQALNRALHEESILHAANYDELTGLPNLAWFFKLFEVCKARNLSEGKPTLLLYMDLNGMKFYNHRNGFAEGDKLLRAFSDILIDLFGKESACHIAADRFAAASSPENIDSRLQKLFREARQMNGGNTLPVRVGIYSSEVEIVPAGMAYDRAKMACDAMHRSDTSGYNYYSRQLRDEVRRHQYLVENIDRAVAERWITPYYQPIVRAFSGKISDMEALARWIDPVEGFLPPSEFVPHLERAGLCYKLDLCILDQVLEKLTREKENGVQSVPHSVNLSRSDFDVCDIVEELRRRVDGAGVERRMITVEITESIIGSNFEFMKSQLDRFRELGFSVWMDDFGSGYSSLDVLQSVQFDLIKFDMSFMRKLDEGEAGKIILTELMKMATSLHLDTVCEGVETEAQVRFLQEIGCSKLQGFFFGRPTPLPQLQEQFGNGEGSRFENPDSAPYYESIGRVNLYDLGSVTGLDENPFQNSFSTLPMAVLEVRGEAARYVRTTPSYREFVRRFFNTDVSAMTKDFTVFRSPFMIRLLTSCSEQQSRLFFDDKMPDGVVVHSFGRWIAAHPSDGRQAIAVAVLSVSDPAANKV